MREYTIITDSCCDLPQEMAEKMELRILPLHLMMNGREYKNYLDERDISYTDFYAMLPKAHDVKTSAVNQAEFMCEMESLLADGRDILYVGFSSALSGTCSAGFLAAQAMREKYPERRILCVDSLCASLGQGLLLYLLWQRKQLGRTIEDVHAYAEKIKQKICHWFTVDDLKHLQRGGRLSGAAALIGSVLSIKPVMHMDDAGRLTPVDKVRGRKASLKRLVSEMKARMDGEDQTVFISHGDSRADAEYTAELIRSEISVKDIIINYVGPVIGAHSGPGTIAVFFVGNER